jgi:hypothetical protein
MAGNYGAPPVRGPQHSRLNVFVGTWHAEGHSYGGEQQDRTQPRARPTRWVSDETTGWHPGGFFLIQSEQAQIGADSLITHAVLGYDADAGQLVAHAFENHGHYRKYAVRVEGRIWTLTAQLERATIEFSEDGNRQTVRWEWRPFDDEWLPLCERVNDKVQ